jgi:hypothetical protein
MNQHEFDEEHPLWRAPPPGPYRLPTAVLTLSRSSLNYTLTAFRATAALRVEACCFWYGLRSDDGAGIVLAVVIPKQRNTWGNYFVPAAAVAEMAAATRPRKWVNLAQVHSHPGENVEHSRYDDANANSRRALSVVIPSYGRWRGPWPTGIGVHDFQDGYWHLLSDSNAAHRLVLADTGDAELLDLR